MSLTLTSAGTSTTYQNPVHPRACADPFVLKHAGEYWAYCTGLQPDGRAFGILRSADLVRWVEVGSAIDLLPGGHTCYWAPEVAYHNGRFYFYYSVGTETTMHIRVALSPRPQGPFVDSGRRLTQEDFAIDGHVFVDDDGQRYFFYATDFLEHTHIGTGTVVDRMLDPLRLEGKPRPVTRARFDWQVYDPARAEKGGVRWHTVEGPFVLKRKGRYYQMFSGGNWQNVTYGVSYATSQEVQPEGEWQQDCDGERVAPVLRTLPEAGIIGPGHNSVVRGPDNRQLFCVYHRWQPEIEARVPAIDRLEWVGDRLLVLGPSSTPQPAPRRPAVAGFGSSLSPSLAPEWELIGGLWSLSGGRAQQAAAVPAAAARLLLPAPDFLLEVTLAAAEAKAANGNGHGHANGKRQRAGTFGLSLEGAAGEMLRVGLAPAGGKVFVSRGTLEAAQLLPEDFDFGADHLLRVTLNAGKVYVTLDDVLLRWMGEVGPVNAAALFTQQMAASFAGFELSLGWQDDFADEAATPAALGWQPQNQNGDWAVAGQALAQRDAAADGALLAKGWPLEQYELVVNARLDRIGTASAGPAGYGFYPVYAGPDDRGPLFTVEQRESGWRLVWRPGPAPEAMSPEQTRLSGGHQFPLPAGFDPYEYQQFRFRLQGGQLSVQWAGQPLGGIQAPGRPGRVGLYTHRAAAAFEMVRVG